MSNVKYSKNAQKQLRSLSKHMARQVRDKCEKYGSDPVAYRKWGESVKNTKYHRLRKGKMRMLFEHKNGYIFVSKIEKRDSVYKNI